MSSLSPTALMLLVLAGVVVYSGCSKVAGKPKTASSKQGPVTARDVAPQLAANLNINHPLGVVPQSLFLPSQSARYWTPVAGYVQSKSRKGEYLLHDGSRVTIYNEGIGGPPPLYLS